MTKEELLLPRLITIAEDTSGNLKVGEIFGFDDEFGIHWTSKNAFTPEEITRFPHLFRKLDWWEHRNIEDMPEYVREDSGNGYLYKVEKYTITEDGSMKMLLENGYNYYCNKNVMWFFQPATEQEYIEYINQK